MSSRFASPVTVTLGRQYTSDMITKPNTGERIAHEVSPRCTVVLMYAPVSEDMPTRYLSEIVEVRTPMDILNLLKRQKELDKDGYVSNAIAYNDGLYLNDVTITGAR